ncbi:MAG TPA: methyltransferase domain-containing protein [Acidobacteriaceae bacterium]|nr:methyltransferase domain-containing protein [Acidobacteriaceae bacterium]
MLTNVQYWILKAIDAGLPNRGPSVYEGKSKLVMLLGDEFLNRIAGKTIVDFGCGYGIEAIEMAQRGAQRVIGVDIREDVLKTARQNAFAAGAQNVCSFGSSTNELAEIIVSIDAFEHFADPAGILRIMERLLQPAGEVLISFGPTWYHPLGGHLFSVFPWAHLMFREQALIRWRSTFKMDGATRFGEVAGGLNQITIRRFEELIESSPFRYASMELVPIKSLRYLHHKFTRECTTALVRCRLVKRAAGNTQD